ncbi:FtsK/SpoIIIE domain-containing protein [Pseudarthrobacter sp. J64]|uniref:FtsK/SpoIIIE domain-containing protein n=1 Tax=Pseudarthrobacter sp. J64 TaxID=3116485 RepID=UPI002E810B21|nr:FtsK/SpoIIIE domain-containing protein [Pseudarthrobacter sp. J64]MEE2568309.1 FtsK/SpoIIIE domain-containing protein [Pseudarthrobacter sp. J64]
MLLHCTLVRGPQADGDRSPLELSLDLPKNASGQDIEAAISERFGTAGLLFAGSPLAAISKVAGTLPQGAVLVEASAASRREGNVRRRQATDQPLLSLVIHTGAGAGTVVPLKRGSYGIGRNAGDIVVPDPQMSREHARLNVTDTSVSITDLESANGTLIDGTAKRAAVISTDSVVRCGDSFMTISSGTPMMPRHHLDEAGASVAEPIMVPAPQPQTNRTALLITALAPLLIGVGLAVMTGMWMFLAFSAMSGAAVLIPVFSGRRQRKDFRDALSRASRQDKDRRRRAAPSVADILFADTTGAMERPWHPADCHGTWLRIGLAEQPANIALGPSGTADPPRPAALLPLTVDPAAPLVSVRGPHPLRKAFVHSLLLQLTHTPRAACTRVVLHGSAESLPLAARFLPHVQLSANHARTRQLLSSPKTCHGVLLLTDPSDSEAMLDVAASCSWQVFQFLPAGSEPAAVDIELSEHGSVFSKDGGRLNMIPDLVAHAVFDRATRARNCALEAEELRPGIPGTCSLPDLLPATPLAIGGRWAEGRTAPGLKAPVGVSADGTRFMDLESDGPHVLVAGTTGSGKSELLRSFTAGLALSYPPDRVNFLFIDFKGGSGLAPLAALPHCVGLLTDLSPDELERFLASLRSEIRRRERLLAASDTPDLAAYRQSAFSRTEPVPQLVLVIDEFRMLVEDASNALAELMRIATIGRSLGLHLIMATQRPQGAITADIRANVTTSIALRVQSEMESLDVINGKEAACIGVETPGRAYMARGTEPPSEFQAASLAAGPRQEGSRISVLTAKEATSVSDRESHLLTAAADITPAAAAAPLIRMLSQLWADNNGAPPRRPVAPSLPAELVYPDAPGPADSTDPDTFLVTLGILDKPDEQRLAEMTWEPCTQGHLAVVGSPAAGGPSALLVITVGQLLRQRTDAHLYLLDGLGTLEPLAATGRIGAIAGVHELRRGVRIIERIHQEMTERLSRPAGERGTRVVLVLAGWGAWVSAMRSGPLMWAEDLVQDIVRDGTNANISVIVSGERELVTSRFFAALPNRIYCPTGSTEESRLAWPVMPKTAPLPGRAVAFGPVALGGPAVCQLYTSGSAVRDRPHDLIQPVSPPFRVDPLPAVLGWEFIDSLAPGTTPRSANGPDGRRTADGTRPRASVLRRQSLLLGVGGDDLKPVSLRFAAGSVLAVLGRPGSGRSSVLRSLPLLNPMPLGWLAPGPDDDPAAYWEAIHASVAAGALAPGSVCLVDDADRLPAAINQMLVDINSRGLSVVVTAAYGSALMHRVPVASTARNCGGGLLLAPRSLMDGEMFATRFDLEAAPPPGRAVLVTDGAAMALQLPFLPEQEEPVSAAAA